MLPSDRMELEILDRVIECTDNLGYPTNLTALANVLRSAIGAATDSEVSAALGRLWREENLALGRYEGSTWVPRVLPPDIVYLFGGDFRLLVTPNSWRRRDSLRPRRKTGVFISHISDEGVVAAALKTALQEAFGQDFPVFVSSDHASIKSGMPWYDEILANLRKAEVIISLLTRRSVDRRWINFEAGVGLGERAMVVPAVVGNFQKNDIGLPLGHLQARDLGSADDLAELLRDIAAACSVSLRPLDYSLVRKALVDAEKSVPDSDVELRLWRNSDNVLKCAIRNQGTKAVHPSEVEVLVPRSVADSDFTFLAAVPVMYRVRQKVDSIEYEGFRLTSTRSTDLRLKMEPLPSVVTRDMGFRQLALQIPLKARLSPQEESQPVVYRVSGSDLSIGPHHVLISAIDGKEPE